MSNVAIQVDHLSKQYRIGAQQQGGSKYKSLREELTKAVRAPIRRAGRLLRGEPYGAAELDETIWALKDVSFEVERGEVVGIIGPNGAGKTTLLKILTRITEPTAGRAVLHGRVGSLLEVGTGFHPELTGRENIYLNGAILGMIKTEIERKFDEIVAFSGVEQFIDTPVKHYSSGMRVRLAFSVAAHLDPEILLIDEVLAVGDAAFQKKCLGKMDDVAKSGRTVLYVSHNMGAVNSLCSSGVYLRGGEVLCNSDASTCINEYLGSLQSDGVAFEQPDEDLSLPVQLLSLRVVDQDNQLVDKVAYDEPFCLEARVLVRRQVSDVYLALHIHDRSLDTVIFSRDFFRRQERLGVREPGLYTYSIQVPRLLLVPGTYYLSFHIAHSTPPRLIDGADYVCSFQLYDPGSAYSRTGLPWRGKIARPLDWSLVQRSNCENATTEA